MIDPEELLDMPIEWTVKDASAYLLRAEVAGQEYLLRINDFPDEPAYTLIVNGEDVLELEDRPEQWTHPRLRG